MNWIQCLTMAFLATTVVIQLLTIRRLHKVNKRIEYDTYNVKGHIQLLLDKLDGKRGVK